MKYIPYLTGTVLLALGLVLPSAGADKGFYFNAEAGANWAQDIDFRSGGGALELDTGARFGGSVGYNFSPHLSAEFDTGWLWNQVKDTDSTLAHMPFIVNGVFRLPIGSKLETYVGAGIGGVYSTFTRDDDFIDEDDDGDIAFGWQAMAGIRYKLNERMSLGAGYKYLFSGETDYHLDNGTIRLDNSHNHTFGVVFNMTF